MFVVLFGLCSIRCLIVLPDVSGSCGAPTVRSLFAIPCDGSRQRARVLREVWPLVQLKRLFRREKGMRSFWIKCGFLTLWMLSCSRGIMAQDMQVVVLDALDGNLKGTLRSNFVARPQHNSEHQNARTDDDGSAKFSNPCSAEEEIEISIYPPNKKEQCGVGSISRFVRPVSGPSVYQI